MQIDLPFLRFKEFSIGKRKMLFCWSLARDVGPEKYVLTLLVSVVAQVPCMIRLFFGEVLQPCAGVGFLFRPVGISDMLNLGVRANRITHARAGINRIYN